MQLESKSRVKPALSASIKLLHLCQCLDTLGTQVLAHVLSIFQNANGLNVGQKLAAGSAHRKAAAIAKHRLLAAILTDCHYGCLTCS